MFKNLSIGRKLAAAFALVVAILMVLSAAFYTNFFRLDQANSWNVHSYQVIDESRGIVESLVNMER